MIACNSRAEKWWSKEIKKATIRKRGIREIFVDKKYDRIGGVPVHWSLEGSQRDGRRKKERKYRKK